MRDTTGEEMVHLLDAISTNVTSFFRERDHFEFTSGAMDEWLAAGRKQFRFWSAACSTGEEPYSLAMTLLDAARGRGIDLKILATDISTRVLEKAQEGVYESDRLEGVPSAFRDRYFDRHHEGRNAVYPIKSAVRDIITFKRLNLSTPPFPMHGPFDAIFCRNVMIYFDIHTVGISEMRTSTRPGDVLVTYSLGSCIGLALYGPAARIGGVDTLHVTAVQPGSGEGQG
jgi:chemotaxis protein methyltransferase CheR